MRTGIEAGYEGLQELGRENECVRESGRIMKDMAMGLRKGFTTGSCAASAAKAACCMLLMGRRLDTVSIVTPAGIRYDAGIEDISRGEGWVSCAVRKDGGDDPDITNGMLIYAKVSARENAGAGESAEDVADRLSGGLAAGETADASDGETDGALAAGSYGEAGGALADGNRGELGDDVSVEITGGPGIGVVTRPGLDRSVGSYAINSVPLQMIRQEVLAVARLAEFSGHIEVIISAPEGERIAARTFNPRLGIEGGISIIGTSGIVEPMSTRALLDTIRLELRQRKESGYDDVVIAPGNYGRELLLHSFGYDIEQSVKCSNFIGETIDMAAALGFQRLLLAGHIGKLVKVAGGIMNTHSREADCRMELLTAFAAIHGAERNLASDIMACSTTEEAIRLLDAAGLLPEVMDEVIERIQFHLADRIRRGTESKGLSVSGDMRTESKDLYVSGDMQMDVIVYSNEYGILGMSEGAKEWFTLLAQDAARQI